MVRTIAVASLVLMAAGCSGGSGFGGVAGGEPDEGPERPSGPGAADQAGQDWMRVTLCTSRGPVHLDMPGPVDFDGPRPLRNLDEPTNGTFALSTSPDDAMRYDAVVIDDARQYGTDDTSMATAVITQLDGNAASVDIGEVWSWGTHREITYSEAFNNWELYARAYAAGEVVFIIDMGVRPGASDERVAAAKIDLERMQTSVDFPGLDGAEPGACAGPTQEPVIDPDAEDETER